MKIFKFIIFSVVLILFLSFTPLAKKYIVIDVGHGGEDFGARYQNYVEKDIVLDLAKKRFRKNSNLKINTKLFLPEIPTKTKLF